METAAELVLFLCSSRANKLTGKLVSAKWDGWQQWKKKDLEKIKKMAEGHQNITILGWIDDNQLLDYLGRCLATIYIPIREDFGMSAVESMQAGKPVIGVAEGGLLEIISDHKNGLLLKPDFTTPDLAAAVRQITPDLAKTMEISCQETAAKFGEQSFVEGMKNAIKSS